MRIFAIVFCLVSFFVTSVRAEGVSYDMLAYAIRQGDVQKVKDLFDLGYKNTNPREKDLLVEAVKSGDTKMVQTLLDHGIDINIYSKDTSGKVWNGNENLVSVAVSLVGTRSPGTKAVKKSTQGSSQRAALKGKAPLQSNLVRDKYIEMIDFLIAKGYRPDQFKNPISQAIKDHKLDLISYLRENGVPIYDSVIYDLVSENCENPNIYSVLDTIISKGGVNINHQNSDRYNQYNFGTTALHIAVGRENLKLTKYLVTNGAKKDISGGSYYPNYKPKTPLELAISKGYIEIAKLLKNQP